MIAARRRKFPNSRLKIFWFFTFLRKKIAEVFRLQTIYYVRPLMQNNISWRPQNKWGPPGLARWRWDLVHFREFFRIFGKILATFLGAKRPGRHKLGTSEEQDRSHRVRCFEKKNWPTPRRVLDLIILGRLSKLFSKKLRAKRAALRHPVAPSIETPQQKKSKKNGCDDEKKSCEKFHQIIFENFES